MFENLFLRKKAIPEKLISFGFVKKGSQYQYETMIMDDDFRLVISIDQTGVPDTTLTEAATGEAYVLYKTNASGLFVEQIRAAVEEVLSSVAEHCYEAAVFKAEQSVQVIEYVRKKYHDEPEYLWDRFPDNAVWRRKDNQKWYGVLLTVARRKLGLPSDEVVEIIDFRAQPDMLEKLIDGRRYYPGWHMNKKHWGTIILDGSVSFEEICRRIDESYLLAK
ncbi:MAG: hypothetical protein HFE78_04640 [Clostridiales bacterium]|nr:hypothetical protein [Clostridiales bacterium]